MPPDPQTHFMAQYVAHQGRIYRYILTLVPHSADAEELFQQTSLTLWEKRDDFDPARGSFPQWAFGFAINHVRNHRRKQGRRGPGFTLSDAALDRIAAARAAADDAFEDRRSALTGCLDKLPAPQRRIVERYYDDVAIDDLAAETGHTRDAVYKTLQRVRRALFDCINASLGEGGSA